MGRDIKAIAIAATGLYQQRPIFVDGRKRLHGTNFLVFPKAPFPALLSRGSSSRNLTWQS
jgi:hypothetical protein